jgi:uncharacterized protein
MPPLLLVPLGFAIGAYGTLIGAGGGFVLVPALLFLYPHERPATITSVSLAVVFFNALSGSVAYARQRRIDYKTGIRFALATAPGAILGARVVGLFSRGLFDVVFGSVMVGVAAFVIVRGRNRPIRVTPPHPGMATRVITDASGETYMYRFWEWQGIALSAGVGFLSSLLGIGGGIIHVPVLVEFLHFPVHIATATSHFILTFMALIGSVGYITAGTLGPHAGFSQVLLLSLGVVPGAQLGARFSHHVRGGLIFRLLGFALLMVGVRLIVTPLIG